MNSALVASHNTDPKSSDLRLQQFIHQTLVQLEASANCIEHSSRYGGRKASCHDVGHFDLDDHLVRWAEYSRLVKLARIPVERRVIGGTNSYFLLGQQNGQTLSSWRFSAPVGVCRPSCM